MKQCLLGLMAAALFFFGNPSVDAHGILYVPMDNRPVNLEYVADTVRSAGAEVIAPSEAQLSGRTERANPDAIWKWVFENCKDADAAVLSSDTLIYGGLVSSRTHLYSEKELQRRLANFERLKQENPQLRLYVFGTIMRTPHYSAGGVEPDYYETRGHDIFLTTALEDKQEMGIASRAETEQLKTLKASIPNSIWADWNSRRAKNYKVNVALVNMVRQGEFTHLLIGRDDCSPFSQSHRESRWLSAEAAGLSASVYTSFPGADQLGMLMVTRAINDLNFRVPMVNVIFAGGAGEKTVPTYEDRPVGESLRLQLNAAGCIPVDSQAADLVLAVNTPESGITREANSPANVVKSSAVIDALVDDIKMNLDKGKRVAVADIAYGNGADNAFMERLSAEGLLGRLASYSGWNTAGNTIGFAIGQGVLSAQMAAADRQRLLAIRYLDDWAYQANVREAIDNQMLYPLGRSVVQLDELEPLVAQETKRQMEAFATNHFFLFDVPDFEVSFPWNRMFEVRLGVAKH